MTDEVKIEAEAAVEAPPAPVAQAAPKAAAKAAKAAPKPKAPSKKTVKARRAKPQKRKAAAARKRNDPMKNETTNIFAGFGAFPGAASFEKLFTDAAQRGEDAVKRSRKAAEELADLYRGNVDAFVEAGKIAANGAQSIGQEIVAKGRDSVEQTASTVRSFAEAKSPTELLQLQSDFARTAFDRFVEDSSNLTESLVKLAGEAFQPISNRASANVERFNEIAA